MSSNKISTKKKQICPDGNKRTIYYNENSKAGTLYYKVKDQNGKFQFKVLPKKKKIHTGGEECKTKGNWSGECVSDTKDKCDACNSEGKVCSNDGRGKGGCGANFCVYCKDIGQV
jgi:hypothetical protein